MHCGTWLVEGNPQVILFDIGSASWKLDEFKQELWSNTKIGIPQPDIETNDALLLGYMVATFLGEVIVIYFCILYFSFFLRLVLADKILNGSYFMLI